VVLTELAHALIPDQVVMLDCTDPMAEKGMPEIDEMSDFRGKPSVGAGL
jgi:hypothetical protein